MIELQQVGYSYGNNALVEDVNFVAKPGEVTALMGNNGSGKTTLVRLICGDLQPASGRILFYDRPVSFWKGAEIAKCRAVVPQFSTLAFSFSVIEVVMMGRIPHVEASRATDYTIAETALAEVGLSAVADRDYTVLSGGERQRVHFARALAQLQEAREMGEGALLLDEPTAHLDLAHQYSVMSLARTLAADGLSVLTVIHDLNQALRFADQVVVLHDGQIAGAGNPADVLEPEFVQRVFGLPMDRLYTHDGLPVLFPDSTFESDENDENLYLNERKVV